MTTIHETSHFTHCYQGEYETTCKYGEDCPAKPVERLIALNVFVLVERFVGKNNNEFADDVVLAVYGCQEEAESKAKFMAKPCYEYEIVTTKFYD